MVLITKESGKKTKIPEILSIQTCLQDLASLDIPLLVQGILDLTIDLLEQRDALGVLRGREVAGDEVLEQPQLREPVGAVRREVERRQALILVADGGGEPLLGRLGLV